MRARRAAHDSRERGFGRAARHMPADGDAAGSRSAGAGRGRRCRGAVLPGSPVRRPGAGGRRAPGPGRHLHRSSSTPATRAPRTSTGRAWSPPSRPSRRATATRSTCGRPRTTAPPGSSSASRAPASPTTRPRTSASATPTSPRTLGGRIYNTGIDLANDALFSSNDGGLSWGPGTVQCHEGDRPWLAGARQDEVFLSTDTEEAGHQVFQSTDGGSSCLPTPHNRPTGSCPTAPAGREWASSTTTARRTSSSSPT